MRLGATRRRRPHLYDPEQLAGEVIEVGLTLLAGQLELGGGEGQYVGADDKDRGRSDCKKGPEGLLQCVRDARCTASTADKHSRVVGDISRPPPPLQ